MPILKRNTLLLLICTLTLLSCDPPEFKEDLFSASYIKNEGNEVGEGKDPKDLKDPEPEAEKPIDLSPPKSRKVKETFYQVKSQREKVDILWVVDNSGSMEEEQDSLARNFDLFIEEFLKKDIDFKMAITTTDPYDYGRAVKGIEGLTKSEALKDEAAFLDDFIERVRVGINGYGKEQGLKTSLNFLNRYGSNFLRKGAFLIVIYLSDEDDQSGIYPDRFYELIIKHKSNPGQVKIFSIVNLKGQSHSYYESPGERYCTLSEKTGGLCSNIRDDFSQILQDFGKKMAELKDIFLLKKQPYGNKFEVLVEGRSVLSGWSYDEKSNAIKFEENALPVEGEKVEVIYSLKI